MPQELSISSTGPHSNVAEFSETDERLIARYGQRSEPTVCAAGVRLLLPTWGRVHTLQLQSIGIGKENGVMPFAAVVLGIVCRSIQHRCVDPPNNIVHQIDRRPAFNCPRDMVQANFTDCRERQEAELFCWVLMI